ncbi:MAG: HEAT repeat domain-containing protein [Candidatus Heimdallarchaeota archaeon]|nr:HEAT repeat domain-containing protein [Candidatus Heimdallarchaeota archaeon]MBY8995415.1 HEAT repeat domain-containing protein [Candidatus Heimdallarchaeota archaeon]
MSKATERITKISLIAILMIMIAPAISASLVSGIVDFDGPRTIDPGYTDAFQYTIDTFKNYRFTVLVEFNETVNPSFLLNVFVVKNEVWEEMLAGTTTRHNMTSEDYLYNATVYHAVDLSYDVVIPDWDDWTFVFFNPNSVEMLTQIRLARQHILWWLWIVIPVLVVIGLVAYGVVENVTKYERARMDIDKAMGKLSSRSESERKRAAYWLISNGTKEELLQLSQMLDHDKAAVKQEAAFALGGISKRVGDKSYANSLLKKYEVEEDAEVKEAIVSALCDVASSSSLPIFEKYILSEYNEHLKFRIAEALAEIATMKSVPVLLKVIEGDNTDTLKIACKRALEVIAKKEGTAVESLMKQA